MFFFKGKVSSATTIYGTAIEIHSTDFRRQESGAHFVPGLVKVRTWKSSAVRISPVASGINENESIASIYQGHEYDAMSFHIIEEA